MKILFISSLYAPHISGGAEIILQRTVEGFKSRGYHVSVLSTGPEPGLIQEWVNDVKVYRAGNGYWHFNKQRQGRLARLGWHLRDCYNRGMRNYVSTVMATEKIDLVVCHNLSGWSVSVWDEISDAGIPIVQVLHDTYLLCPRSSMFKKSCSCTVQCGLCKQFRKGHAKYSEQVTSVVGVSHYLLDTLIKHGYFPTAKSYVVHNSSPAVSYSRSTTPTETGRPLRFGFMGRLIQVKGLEWLIDQFQKLPFDATLQIAGHGELDYEAYLKTLVSSPNISFIGYQTPATFYPHIDVALVPSVWAEPFGMVAVEACAYSVPVIASCRGGLPEIIIDNYNGLLCDPDVPDSLGQAMLRLHQQPGLRRQLAKTTRESVASLLNIDLMLDGYQRVFTQAIQSKINSNED